MEIATTMWSRAQKKRIKEQQRETKKIKIAIYILSTLLPKTNTGSFVTPIDKPG